MTRFVGDTRAEDAKRPNIEVEGEGVIIGDDVIFGQILGQGCTAPEYRGEA